MEGGCRARVFACRVLRARGLRGRSLGPRAGRIRSGLFVGAERAAIVTERLLDGVVAHRARFAILDLTGIENVDTSTAHYLFNIMRGVDLLGCTPLISGIQPSVAMTMVTIGVNIPAGRTYATLADALQRCVRASDEPSG